MPSSGVKEKGVKSKKDSTSSKKSSKVVPPSKNAKSSERISESDRDSETSSDGTSSDDASDSEELPEKPTKATKASNGKKVAATESSDESGSGDESSSESSDEEASDAENATAIQPPNGAPKSKSNTVRFQAPAPFRPPPGFELVSKSTDDASFAISNMFSKSNLAGKEIWYITAPASVPASAITKISIEHSKGGISHNGKDYAFVQDNVDDKKSTKLLIPSGSSQDYSLGAQTIKQTLHLQQVVDLPNAFGHNGSIAPEASRATVPAAKPVRQQPKGLKMRFRPIGFGEGTAGTIGDESDSDAEMADAPAQFRAPEVDVDSSKKSKKSKKSKHADSDDEAKKSKKDKSKKKRKLSEEEAKSSSSIITPSADNIVLKHKKNRLSAKEHHIGQEMPPPLVPQSISSKDIKIESTTPILPPMRKSSVPSISSQSKMSTPVPPPGDLTTAATSPSMTVTTPKCTLIPAPTRRRSTLVSPTPIIPSKAPQTTTSEVTEKSPKKPHDSKLTLEERFKAIDPNLSKSERKAEKKRLKKLNSLERRANGELL